MRAEFFSRAHWSVEASAYVAKNGVDMQAVNARGILLSIIDSNFFGNGHFDFADEGGTPAVVIEVLGDDEATIDLVAWPVDHSETFATMLGSDVLGMARVLSPATWTAGYALNVFKTPLRWLQAGCDGCVVLDHRNVPAWLGKVSGPIQAEDVDHARQLDAWLNPRFDRRRILVPRNSATRAA